MGEESVIVDDRVLSILVKNSIGPGLGTSATLIMVAVIGILMIAALTLFGQFGEVIARAIQLARMVINLVLRGLVTGRRGGRDGRRRGSRVSEPDTSRIFVKDLNSG